MQEEKEDIITNFKALFQVIWREKVLFVLIVLFFASLGLWYGFTTQEQFVSEGKILPELQEQGGKLGGLAGLASLGVDLASMGGTEAIRPDLYPNVLSSTPFILELFKQKVTNSENKTMPFEEFYHQVVEKGDEIEQEDKEKFPVKENGFLVLNRLSEDRIEDLKERITADIDKKSGVVSISVKMPDPVIAAGIARFSMVYLTEYVTRYRTGKAKKEVDFLEERVNLARGKLYTNQVKKAQYGDQFQLPTIRLQSADIQRERIESEYRISSTFYTELLKKYEEAKIKLQQETPVFQVLDPPIAPTQKSEPKRAIILLIALFLGVIIAMIAVLVKEKNYKKIIAYNI